LGGFHQFGSVLDWVILKAVEDILGHHVLDLRVGIKFRLVISDTFMGWVSKGTFIWDSIHPASGAPVTSRGSRNLKP
jgi:hypothetical protein